MSSLDPHIFRAYDIRGKAGSQITEESCKQIGKAFGSILRELYEKENPRVIVGWDARTHSPNLAQATIEGLTSAGCTVLSMGQTPSPINYFTTCALGLDGGIQITASHNPAEDNGLKLQVRNAVSFCGDNLQVLRQRIENGDYLDGEGTFEEVNAISGYTNAITGLFSGIELSVVVDSGNGVAGPVYTQILENVGCKVEGLFIEPDGTFPNHPADPSKWDTLKDLQTKVVEVHADIGLAFDGDGDRLGIVDETGTIRSADEILLLLAQDHLGRNPGGTVVFTVSNSGTLQSEITAWGGNPVMCKVGHSFVEHVMKENESKLGGEQSGHFFCGENYYGFDDALVAALWVLKIVSERRNDSDTTPTVSEIFSAFPKVYQAQEWRPNCSDAQKTKIVEAISKHFAKSFDVNTLDGVRIDFGDGAWAGIRQSNTNPKLSVCIEARSPEKLAEIESIIHQHMETYPEIENLAP